MVTPKLGVAAILCLNFIIRNPSELGPGQQQSKDCGRPATSSDGFHIIKFKHKMDATPSFGVTMIPEVPSNPQLTLVKVAKVMLLLKPALRSAMRDPFPVCGSHAIFLLPAFSKVSP